ncbi:MAG: hypothetical protein R3F11_15010 [Verrucomicrobiales bacterium]
MPHYWASCADCGSSSAVLTTWASAWEASRRSDSASLWFAGVAGSSASARKTRAKSCYSGG